MVARSAAAVFRTTVNECHQVFADLREAALEFGFAKQLSNIKNVENKTWYGKSESWTSLIGGGIEAGGHIFSAFLPKGVSELAKGVATVARPLTDSGRSYIHALGVKPENDIQIYQQTVANKTERDRSLSEKDKELKQAADRAADAESQARQKAVSQR